MIHEPTADEVRASIRDILASNLGRDAKMLGLSLIAHGTGLGTPYPSLDQLASEANIGPDQVRQAIRKLVQTHRVSPDLISYYDARRK
jgi:hypothetical protein